MQYRVSPEFLTNEYDNSMKAVIFHRNTNSCGAMEITTQNRHSYNDIQMYWHCSPPLITKVDSPEYDGDELEESNPLTQQAWDLSSGPSYIEELGSSNVAYPNVGTQFATDEWMTLDWYTTLKQFRHEFEAHVKEGRCTLPAPWRARHGAFAHAH
jgi:hypothetical protein